MTDKIEISRELAVKRLTEIANRDSAVSVTVRAEDLRALLAAPAVERQEPVGFRYRANGDWELMEESPFADGRISHKEGGEELQPLYTYQPAPAVERQEPVGEVADMKYNRVQFYRATGDTSKPYLQPGTKLYASPPAPVSNEQPVAYMRNEVTPNNLVLCSFNDPGAFGVYRGPKSVPVAVVLDERAAFEKTVIDMADRFHPDLSKYGIDGEYKHAQLQYAWELWQARACIDKGKEMNE